MPLSGILPVIVTVGVWPRIEHPLKASEVMVPRPAPGRPEPCLSVPFATEDVQVTDWPAVLSVITVFPAVPVVAPPGLTVHVAAVANAGAAAMPMTAAVAALVISALPKRLRIALAPFRRGLLHRYRDPTTQHARIVAVWHRPGRTFRT